MKTTIYLDNSVIGGCFDDEFSKYSVQLFEEIKSGEFQPIVSDLTLAELKSAPDFVQKKFEEIREIAEIINFDEEAAELAQKYIKEGDFTEKSIIDMNQIAIASINKVDVIVSWNFRHIVNLNRIKLYNGVNIKSGYSPIEVRTPREVLGEG